MPRQIPSFHPRRDDAGQPVPIHHPTLPGPLSAFEDPAKTAVVAPDSAVPEHLNGVVLAPWKDAPMTMQNWTLVPGQIPLSEPALPSRQGKHSATGVVIIEPDGRVWLSEPTNAHGGYKVSFPKGRVESGLALQATAIKEGFEETGLQVRITALLGDFTRSTTVTRFYIARRIGGSPAKMGWETQAVYLAPLVQLPHLLNQATDHVVLRELNAWLSCNDK